MITASQPVEADDVAQHYDELDDCYRDIWGEHLHHGLWDGEGDERSVQEATTHFLENLTSPLTIRPGQHYADIGCGYGAPARWIATRHRIRLTAFTLSTRQWEQARQATPPTQGSVTYLLEDWLQNSLPDESLDGALAIEVLAHVADKDHFFRQLTRTLKPHASCAMALWTIADDLEAPERFLIRHLCRDGRLAGIGTMDDYRQLATRAGLRIVQTNDVSPRVARTWSLITRRTLTKAFTTPRHLRHLLRRPLTLVTLSTMLLAYRTGALRYALITLQKPAP